MEHNNIIIWNLNSTQQKNLLIHIYSSTIKFNIFILFFYLSMKQQGARAKKTIQCSRCGGSEFDSNDQGYVCLGCGIIQEQINFDNNVVFGKQKQLQGKNINKQQSNKLSRQRRLKKAEDKIKDLVRKLQIPSNYDVAVKAALRLLGIADDCNFFKKGKKIQLYAAAALYITLRFQKAPYLLIDFSDKMGIKMFPLARCFLKMSKKFGFQQQLPLIDPSLFIHRYCKMMNLGEKLESVTMSAIRLIKRMKRDWMCQGRRPSSLCGAAILIATKIHGISNQHCSTTQICKTVFVCDQTIRRRLDEFKLTKISKLTLQQFEKEQKQEEILGAQSDMDPPAFRKARLRSVDYQRQLQQQVVFNKKKNDEQNLEEQIPEQFIQRYTDQIAKNYQLASNRIPMIQEQMQGANDLSDLESNNTGGKGQLGDEQDDNSDISQNLVFLDQQQQKKKKENWEKYYEQWIDKQEAKAKRQQIQTKKKQKKKKNQQKIENPYQALIKNPKMGQKVNQEQLKRLLASQPKLQQPQTPKISITKIFNAFRYTKL